MQARAFSKRINTNSILFAVFVACSFGTLCEKGTTLYQYTLGEWLINYDAGFVRRGLAGTLFFLCSDLLGVNTELLVNSFLVCLFVINLFFVWQILRFLNSLQVFWFLFSPALFLMVATVNIDRKENLFYLLIMIHSVLVIEKSRFLRVWQDYILPMAGCLIVLVHEIYVFVVPYHLLLIWITNQASAQRQKKRILVNCIPFLLLVPVIYFHGDAQQVYKMCLTLLIHGVNCEGGVTALEMSLFDSARTSLKIFGDFYSTLAYLVCFCVSNGVVLFLFRGALKNIYDKKIFGALIGCNLIFLLIFPLGEDFGRWITIFGIHNFVFLTVISTLEGEINEMLLKSKTRLTLEWVLLIVLSFTFNLKYWGGYDQEKYHLIPGKMLGFLENGLSSILRLDQINFKKNTLKLNFTKAPLKTGEVVNFKDNRLLFLGWGSEEQVKWTTSHYSSIFFYWDSHSSGVAGEIEMFIGGVARTQRVTAFLNEVKIGMFELERGAEKVAFRFPPELLKKDQEINQLLLSLPDAARPTNGDLRKLSFYLRTMAIK